MDLLTRKLMSLQDEGEVIAHLDWSNMKYWEGKYGRDLSYLGISNYLRGYGVNKMKLYIPHFDMEMQDYKQINEWATRHDERLPGKMDKKIEEVMKRVKKKVEFEMDRCGEKRDRVYEELFRLRSKIVFALIGLERNSENEMLKSLGYILITRNMLFNEDGADVQYLMSRYDEMFDELFKTLERKQLVDKKKSWERGRVLRKEKNYAEMKLEKKELSKVIQRRWGKVIVCNLDQEISAYAMQARKAIAQVFFTGDGGFKVIYDTLMTEYGQSVMVVAPKKFRPRCLPRFDVSNGLTVVDPQTVKEFWR